MRGGGDGGEGRGRGPSRGGVGMTVQEVLMNDQARPLFKTSKQIE